MLMPGIDPLQGKRFLVRKRDGRIEEFNEARILLAMESAFGAVLGLGPNASLPDSAKSAVTNCSAKAVALVLARALGGEELEVERIQDTVEDQLMLAGHLEVARRYILYREKRRLARAERESGLKSSPAIQKTSAAPTATPRSNIPELEGIYRQALPRQGGGNEFEDAYRRHFDGFLNEGEYWRLLSPQLLEYDSSRLAGRLRLERDRQFTATRLEALRERYLLREQGRCLETPQYFWMRVSMGLALNEAGDWEGRALEFYDAISTFRFLPSGRILKQAGTPNPALADGGGADLPGPWMEAWRRDILNAPAPRTIWLPDLFMKRVRQQAEWTLFDPGETGDLRDCCGSQFEERYLAHELKAKEDAVRFAKRMKAVDLWRAIVTSVAQAGQAWLGFKDAVGLRSMRPCQEVESGPLGAINLAAHVAEPRGALDVALLRGTISAAVRMLDNAVELSVYPTAQARHNALEYRTIGLGLTGLQEAMTRLGLHYESAAAADFAESCMELVSRSAIMASAELARERGSFPGYARSKWSEGILPIDTLGRLSQQRGVPVQVPVETSQDWAATRATILSHGMRNSATTAISPPDIPAAIAGMTPALDPSLPGRAADPKWLLEHAARRQKWLDMGETMTFATAEQDADKLAALYMQAWEKGIKIVRHVSVAAPQAEEAKTVEAGVFAG
jgi:ribonucleotide reductase alpha subunit